MASYKIETVLVFLLLALLNYIGYADACACSYFGYYCCPDGIWCCPHGYICAGSTCITVAVVVVPILIVLGIIVTVVICICVRRKRATRQPGMVMQPTAGQPGAYPAAQYPPPATGYPQYPPPATGGEPPKF